MVDLRQIDLENLPNIDNRIIPQLKLYLIRIMELNGKPLDYRIEEMYNDLVNR